MAAWRAQAYEIIRAIPRGYVMTYGSIAALIPAPQGMDPLSYQRIRARWVAYSLRACPEDVPWHRVVNAKGGISLHPAEGFHLQRAMLRDEGIAFDERQHVDLARCAWRPDNAWLRNHGLLHAER
jgi:methylated-DNA-protein-cysteine methyltransferase-like protein